MSDPSLNAKLTSQPAQPVAWRCSGCGNEIDPGTCHCGDTKDAHGWEHPFIPMGCDCGRASLHDELAAAQADRLDAERLDWLEQHDGRFYNLDRISAIVGTGFNLLPTLRAAIDAARKGGK